MSIFPSVETSMTATLSRAARHSRSTAASMVSPSRGKYQGALPLPDVLEAGTVGEMPRVDRRHPDRIEQVPPVSAGERG